MAIALPSRPEVIVAGRVVGTRNITKRDDRSQVIGVGLTIETPNGDRLGATAWASDAPELVHAGHGDQIAALAYPSGEQLNLSRLIDAKDIEQLAVLAGVK